MAVYVGAALCSSPVSALYCFWFDLFGCMCGMYLSLNVSGNFERIEEYIMVTT